MEVNSYKVIEIMETLDPNLLSKVGDAQLQMYISLAKSIISGLEIDEEKIDFAVALKTLALIYVPENSSLSSKKIKDIEVTYYRGQGKNKWDALFGSFINGEELSNLNLSYVGI